MFTRFTRVAALSVALTLSATSANAARSQYSQFYVFGDSLVDAGNIDALTGIPDETQGYFDGRFTNGYDYTDLLSITAFGSPTTAFLKGGTNFAFGGARVVDTGDFPPDLNAQLGLYASTTLGVADPDALYVLNFGGNDIFGLESGSIGIFASNADYIDALVGQYSAGVGYLDSIGARNILITGIPNAFSPFAASVEARLLGSLDALTLDADTNLLRFSYLDFFGRLQSDPGQFGLPQLDLTTTCLRSRTPGPNIDCTGLFFFDDVHPTAAVQAALAADINRQFRITAVPEAGTWAMMIMGFAFTGAALRRRQRTLGRIALG